MTNLSSEARALLRAARSVDDPTDDDSHRVRASVMAKVGAVGVGAAIGVTTSAFSFAKVGLYFGSAAGKVTAILLIAGLSAGTYAAIRSHVAVNAVAVARGPSRSPNASVTSSLSSTIEPTKSAVRESPLASDSPLTGPALAPAVPAKARPSIAPRRAVHARRTDDLEGEVLLLEGADAELRRGDTSAALARLAEHAAKYPSGVLADEREGVRAIALCRAGRLSEGKAAADRFLSPTRRSSLAARVRTACGIEKPSD
jgi:hypothetical protein